MTKTSYYQKIKKELEALRMVARRAEEAQGAIRPYRRTSVAVARAYNALEEALRQWEQDRVGD
jgi:hypothetical protein